HPGQGGDGPVGVVPGRRPDAVGRRQSHELEGRRPLSGRAGGGCRRISHTGGRRPPPHRTLTPMLTLAIMKPDAVKNRLTGKILAHLEADGFVVRAARLVKLTVAEAESFYEVHRARTFLRHIVTLLTTDSAVARSLQHAGAGRRQ